MRASDYLADVLGSFRKQRLRTLLTATGIGIGAFAITIMIGLSQGLQSYIEDQFVLFGNDRVLIVVPEAVARGERVLTEFLDLGRPARPLTMADEDERKIDRGGLWIKPDQLERLRALPEVDKVAPLTWMEADGIALVDLAPTAAEPVWYETDAAALSSSLLVGTPCVGRAADAQAEAEVLLSPQYATSFGLAPEALVGREVELRMPKMASMQARFLFRDPDSYKDEHQVFRAVIVGLAEKSLFSRMVFVSLPLGREMLRYQSGNSQILSQDKLGFRVNVRVKDGVPLEQAKKSISALGLAAKSVNDYLTNVRRTFLVVEAVLTFFGLLAFLVATLGIVNTLLMAISERTREIGVMKALGATDGLVAGLFAAEAAFIGLVGGAAATLLAVALGLAANAAAKHYVPTAAAIEGYSVFVFPAWLFVGAPLFSALVGCLAGIYPARRAARLDPISALRRG